MVIPDWHEPSGCLRKSNIRAVGAAFIRNEGKGSGMDKNMGSSTTNVEKENTVEAWNGIVPKKKKKTGTRVGRNPRTKKTIETEN